MPRTPAARATASPRHARAPSRTHGRRQPVAGRRRSAARSSTSSSSACRSRRRGATATATTYRGLVRELADRGHDVLFLEHDRPWYADNRDMPTPPWGRTELYRNVSDLKDRFARAVRRADLVIVGLVRGEGGCRRRVGHVDRHGSHGVLRHRHAGHARQARPRRHGVPRSGADPEVRHVPLVHRRPDAAQAGAHVRLAAGAAALLLRGPGAVPPRAAARAQVAHGLPRHLQRRPPAAARAAHAGARARAAPPAVRRRRAAVPGPTSSGRATSSASSTCRPRSTGRSTTARRSR
jgi:hypothetical protein